MAIATRYARLDKAGKSRVLNELCAATGWHRNHARKALRGALRPRVVKPRAPRPPKYDLKVVAALIFCWTTLGMPTGKRLAPMLPELVPVLRRFNELDIDDDTATLLMGMSAATIDRRLASERTKHELKATKPASMPKAQVPVRRLAHHDNALPGFVEVYLVAHDGGNTTGEHAWTLTLTDIATGWTEHRSIRNNTGKWVLTALDDIARVMPFPILGVHSANGPQFNDQLRAWCRQHKIIFTRLRPANNGDCHVEQIDCAIVRTVVGYHRYATEAQLWLLNKIWLLQSQLANYFCPQQKLVSKVRLGAKVSKKYDTATTPHRRAQAHPKVSDEDKAILADTYTGINPAAVQRRIQAITNQLLTLAQAA